MDDKVRTLAEREEVRKALSFIEQDQENIIERQMELTLIPAPTGHERAKAERLCEMFREEGLTDVHIDPFGNAVGIRKGEGGGKTLLLEAHMDTVFPMETELKITREDGWIRCPGIVDDTRGCAVILSVLRGLNAAGIKTAGDIQFAGTVREEGMGSMQGMKYYVQHHPELQASISFDGTGFEEVVYEATGIQSYEFSFYGPGGHAAWAYGKIVNPLAAAGRAAEKITNLEIPETPWCTLAVTGMFAGAYSGIHVIPDKATMLLNFRSESAEELEKLRARIFACIDEACAEEGARWGLEPVAYDFRHVVDIKAGTQDPDSPIIEAALAAARYLGAENAKRSHGGATNCSMAIEAGIPAICLGGGIGYDTKIHSLEEQFREEGAFRSCQCVLLAALLCAGTPAVPSVIV